MVTQHGHTIANHGQTWSVMKNYGNMVNGQSVPWVFNGGKDQNDRNAIERCEPSIQRNIQQMDKSGLLTCILLH